MADVLEQFIERDQKPCNRSWRAVHNILRHDLSVWDSRPLRSITRADVINVLDRVIERGKPVMANLLLAHIKRLFNWTIEHGLIDASPAAKVKPPSPKVERERVLTDQEIYEVWHGADRLGFPFGPVIKLLMLTAQRESEVAAMRWSDLDLEKALWSLPSKSTKAGRPHLVPLSATAIAIIKAQPRLGDYVFPGRLTDGARPVCGFSKVKVRLDKICGVKSWVFHDLRRTAATKLAEMKVPPSVTEKILNHSSANAAGPMGKIYQRYEYLDERREAFRPGRTRSCGSSRRPPASAAPRSSHSHGNRGGFSAAARSVSLRATSKWCARGSSCSHSAEQNALPVHCGRNGHRHMGQSRMKRESRSSGWGEDADCGVAVPFKTRRCLTRHPPVAARLPLHPASHGRSPGGNAMFLQLRAAQRQGAQKEAGPESRPVLWENGIQPPSRARASAPAPAPARWGPVRRRRFFRRFTARCGICHSFRSSAVCNAE